MSSGYSPTAWRWLDSTFGRWMDARVSRIRFELPDRIPSGPLLLVANHVSFWDGFLLRRLQERLRPGAPLHTVMLASELARRPFLRRLGAVGLNPGDAGSFRSLAKELDGLLSSRPEAVVVFFPQGRIWPSFRRPLGFRRGATVLLKRLHHVHPIPVGIHLEGHNRAGLTAYLSAGEPVPPDHRDPRGLEREVEARLDRVLTHISRFGEEAPERWPPPQELWEDERTERGALAPDRNRQRIGTSDER